MRRFAAPLLCLSLLAAFEIGVARDERIWSAAPRTASGVFAVLEAQVIAPAEAPQVVLLGSSRVRDAVPPRAFEAALGLPRGAVLNLGLTSGTPLDALTLYRRHRAKLGKARVLLLGVEDWYQNGAMPPTDRERRFATLEERFGDYVGEVRLSLLVGWVWRTYDARAVLRQAARARLSGGGRVPLAEDGRLRWRTQEKPVGPAEYDVGPDVARSHADFAFDEGRRRQFERLKALAAEDGVTVRLLLEPWRAAYVEEAVRLHPEAMAAFRAWMADDPPLGAETGAALGIEPTGFIDYGHLAETGAARFTAALAEQVRPLLR